MVEYSPKLAETICERLALGESLRKICRDDGYPNTTTIFRWLKRYPEFFEAYNIAREFHVDLIEDELIEIADGAGIDLREDGTVNHDVINRDRLKVDTRKWYLGKQRPKKWGDKVAAEVTGKDGAPLVNIDMEAIARWLAFETSKPKTE